MRVVVGVIGVLGAIAAIMGCRGGEPAPSASAVAPPRGLAPPSLVAGGAELVADPVDPSAVVLAWRAETADVTLALARALPATIPLFVLGPADEGTVAATAFRRAGCPFAFVQTGSATPWVRDFGPLLGRDAGGQTVLVDARYDVRRPGDDGAPRRLAAAWRTRARQLPLAVEGGNLVADGRGVCYSTLRLLERNPERSEPEIRGMLADELGCQRLVFLPRLRHEPTGHVDLTVAFPGGEPLVAEAFPLDGRDDSELAAVWDAVQRETDARATRLPLVRTRRGEVLSFVQVLVLPGRVLHPDYGRLGEPRVLRAQALALRRLAARYPGRRLVSVDLAGKVGLGGGLRCYSLGIP